MPVSSAATRGPAPPSPTTTGAPGVTSRARSRPSIEGSASISARASLDRHVAGEDTAAHRALVADVAHQRRACRRR